MTKWRVVIREPAYTQWDSPGNILHSAEAETIDSGLAVALVVGQYSAGFLLPVRGMDISVRPV